MVKAFAHPLRLEILRALTERASPTDLSRQLGQPLGTVSYHVRVLAELGLLQLVEQAPRRGAIEHYYQVAPGLVAELVSPPLDDQGRQELVRAMGSFRDRLRRIERDSAARGANGSDDRGLVMLLGYPGAVIEAD